MAAPASSAITTVMVSLDVLLDTRIGTLSRLGGSALVEQVLKNAYHTRLDDRFPGVDLLQYQALYAKRDETTLAHSYLTNIIPFFQRLVHYLIQQTVSRPFHENVRVVVNTYPYQLSGDTTQQILAALVTKLIADIELTLPLTVEAEYLPDTQLTPDYCKQTFAAMLMYDYEHWLQMHQPALIARPIPEVTLVAPALYFVQTPTEEDLTLAKNQFQLNPFELLQKTVRGGIDLQLLPVELFSIVKPAT